jgi:PAS domain S-box-containing protein
MYRVLYVDDDPDLLDLGKLFLEQGGEFSVDTIASIPAALSCMQSTNYDVIVSDYQMPEMNGIEFLKQVRGFGNTIPFILFTGRGREEVVIEAINNGADFYLQKGGAPRAQFAELAHKIRQSVTRHRAKDELRAAYEQLTATEEELRSQLEELVENQAALKRSEEKFRDIVETSPDLIWELNPEGTFTYVSPSCIDTLGYSQEEIVGTPVFSLITDTARPGFQEILSRGDRIRRPTNEFDLPFRCRDGHTMVMEIRSVARFDTHGRFTGFRGTARDITEKRKAAAALDESEIKFRALVEHSLDAILIADFTGTMLFANQALCRLIEVPDCQAMIGTTNMMEFVAPESRSAVRHDTSQVSQGIDAYLVTYKLITGSKQEIWVECIGKKIPFMGSVAMLVSLREITERKRAEEKVLESERKFTTVFESNPVALTLVSAADGVFVDVNDTFLKSSGYAREEVIGKRPAELRVFVDTEESARMISQLHEQHHVRGVELRCRGKTGVIRSCRFSSSIIMMGGRPHILSTIEDITERRQAEEALRQANKKLNLLSSITRHDINNQLMTLDGYVTLLHRKIPDPALDSFFSRITKTSNRIDAMIRFTKDYEQVGIHAPLWQDLQTLVNDAGKSATLGTIALKNDLPAGMEVFADPLIARVFYNLIDNALRHGEEITRIRFAVEARDGNRIIVCEDDGDGVADAIKERIFDRGFGKNTGFGLFITREVLDITGITINETGVPGTGARFEIAVPEDKYRFSTSGPQSS